MAHCLRQRSRYRRMAAGMAVKHGLQSAYCLYVPARAGGITATAFFMRGKCYLCKQAVQQQGGMNQV